jgi:hypothetical protein
MSVETLPRAGFADRLGFLSAFQALVNRFRLPRQPRRADTKHMTVDLAESPTITACSPEGDRSLVATLTARIETLEADFAKVEAAAALHRADFERERERCERSRGQLFGIAPLSAGSLVKIMTPEKQKGQR